MKGHGKVKIEDIVVVHNEDKHRGFWKLGRIERLLSGRDGEIRGAVVRVHQGGNQITLLKRPVEKLYPIEVGCNTTTAHEQMDQELDFQIDQTKDDTNQGGHMEGDPNSENAPRRRSSRVTAREARDRILACQYQLTVLLFTLLYC